MAYFNVIFSLPAFWHTRFLEPKVGSRDNSQKAKILKTKVGM